MDKRKLSLKKMLFLFWALTLGLFLTLFFSYTVNILNYYQEKDIEDSQVIVDSYSEKINHELGSIINNINMIYAEDVNYEKIRHDGISEYEWHGAAYLLQNTLSKYINSADYMGAMYFLDKPRKAFRFVWNDRPFSGSGNLLIGEAKSFLLDTLSDYKNTGYFKYENEIYYSYSYGLSGKYVGGMINLSRYFDKSEEYELAFCDKSGKVLSADGSGFAEEKDIQNFISHSKKSGRNNSFLLVKSDISNCDMVLVLVREQKTLYELIFNSNVWIYILIIPIILIGILIILLRGLNRILLQPVEHLVIKSNEMKEETETADNLHWNIVEFEDINREIDTMITDIVTLREEKYREQLRANDAQLQYYQLQVNPHFFLNCLNTINSLLENKKGEAAKDMIYSLSSHFRYVFQNQRSLVMVEEEVKEVRDYCKMYTLKAGIPIFLNIEAGDEVMSVKIPILSIQTFVENSIKYVVKRGLLLNVGVQIRFITDYTGKRSLYIRISDNGDGYPAELLEILNRPATQFEYHSEHVGIENLKYRIRLHYGENAEISFRNAEFGGAVTEIILGEAIDEHTNH